MPLKNNRIDAVNKSLCNASNKPLYLYVVFYA